MYFSVLMDYGKKGGWKVYLLLGIFWDFFVYTNYRSNDSFVELSPQ